MSFLDRWGRGGLPSPTGRDFRPYQVTNQNAVLREPIEFPEGLPDPWEAISFGMGCFWGAEKKFWQLDDVYTTSVGYQGGSVPNPTYEEVCTGLTGHAEVTQVVYDPQIRSLWSLLQVFWENHDPTQGNRQGNDVGSQYRSAIFCSTPAQLELAEESRSRFAEVLQREGLGPITTEVASDTGFPYYLAEDYHQQYLFKVPHGYDCHSSTGLALPDLSS